MQTKTVKVGDIVKIDFTSPKLPDGTLDFLEQSERNSFKVTGIEDGLVVMEDVPFKISQSDLIVG